MVYNAENCRIVFGKAVSGDAMDDFDKMMEAVGNGGIFERLANVDVDDLGEEIYKGTQDVNKLMELAGLVDYGFLDAHGISYGEYLDFASLVPEDGIELARKIIGRYQSCSSLAELARINIVCRALLQNGGMNVPYQSLVLEYNDYLFDHRVENLVRSALVAGNSNDRDLCFILSIFNAFGVPLFGMDDYLVLPENDSTRYKNSLSWLEKAIANKSAEACMLMSVLKYMQQFKESKAMIMFAIGLLEKMDGMEDIDVKGPVEALFGILDELPASDDCKKEAAEYVDKAIGYGSPLADYISQLYWYLIGRPEKLHDEYLIDNLRHLGNIVRICRQYPCDDTFALLRNFTSIYDGSVVCLKNNDVKELYDEFSDNDEISPELRKYIPVRDNLAEGNAIGDIIKIVRNLSDMEKMSISPYYADLVKRMAVPYAFALLRKDNIWLYFLVFEKMDVSAAAL